MASLHFNESDCEVLNFIALEIIPSFVSEPYDEQLWLEFVQLHSSGRTQSSKYKTNKIHSQEDTEIMKKRRLQLIDSDGDFTEESIIHLQQLQEPMLKRYDEMKTMIERYVSNMGSNILDRVTVVDYVWFFHPKFQLL